jgi:hypothetical protein
MRLCARLALELRLGYKESMPINHIGFANETWPSDQRDKVRCIDDGRACECFAKPVSVGGVYEVIKFNARDYILWTAPDFAQGLTRTDFHNHFEPLRTSAAV